MSTNINHEGYERRLAAIETILKSYNLSGKVTPLAYEEAFPFAFNNFIYKVDLDAPVTSSTFPSLPATISPAEPVSAVVIHLSNPVASGMNNTDRIQTDVVSQYLTQNALITSGLQSIVPAVYAWASPKSANPTTESEFGWKISEFKAGQDLDSQFRSFTEEDKIGILEQIADIFATIQRIKIPPSASKFGGFRIDEKGEFISGQCAIISEGPWNSYAEFWATKVRSQLDEAKKSPFLNGWEEDGIKIRIEKLLAVGGISRVLQDVDLTRRCLIHGDFTMNNMLVDKDTKRITGLLDFDLSSVCHPWENFFFGLSDIGGGFLGNSPELMNTVLKGDLESVPQNLEPKDSARWRLAVDWHKIAGERKVERLSDIQGVDQIHALFEFEQSLAPGNLISEKMLKELSQEVLDKRKKANKDKIVQFLDKWDL